MHVGLFKYLSLCGSAPRLTCQTFFQLQIYLVTIPAMTPKGASRRCQIPSKSKDQPPQELESKVELCRPL